MPKPFLYRNAQAHDHLELFLVAAISSLLILRFALYLSGYPQVGGGSLHIAHMLWGGMLMLFSIVLTLSFLGSRVLAGAALFGGTGFGIFIDEIGKFITRDNNYFYKPAVGIIYAIFVTLYLIFNFLTRQRRFTSKEYQMNALYQLEEAVAHDMDKTEQFRVLALLQQAGTRDQLTQQLSTFVKNLNVTTTAKPNILRRLVNGLDKLYVKFWSFKVSRTLVKIFICLEAGLFSGAIIYTVFTNFDETRALLAGQVTYAHLVLLAQLISAIIAAAFAAYGVIRLNGSHDYAFEAFRRATLINIFLTEFFTFLREQFGAIPSFVFNIILLALISYVIYQERRLSHKTIS